MNTKVLVGVCGIGRGHTDRQRPIIEHFADKGRLVIFAYGESLKHYEAEFAGRDNVLVLEVAVPFFAGNQDGLDFQRTAEINEGINSWWNHMALAGAQSFMGKPDLVISDYEPVSAQYAYAYDAPLVTIDQQSKYLIGDFPTQLNGQTYADEIARLRMFFPKAEARIACSFFDVTRKSNAKEQVDIYGPIIKRSVQSMKRAPISNSVLVYISSQKDFVQDASEIADICASMPEYKFQVFAPNSQQFATRKLLPNNMVLFQHGDSHFTTVLQECSGIITTAGHTLLSEAMLLGIPVYAIPLAVYEQQMNAHVIHENNFGMSHDYLSVKPLKEFLANLPSYAQAIEQDKSILLRYSSKAQIITRLQNIIAANR